jgi:mRNA interferase MazF
LLLPKEANLSKQSVINISQVFTFDKKDLIEKVGALSPERIDQVINNMDIILKPKDII